MTLHSIDYEVQPLSANMRINFFQWRSVNARVTLFTLAIFVASIGSLAVYAGGTLFRDSLQLLSDQQFSTVTLMANSVNAQFDERIKGLQLVASTITPEILSKPKDLTALLESRVLFQRQFNAGSFVVNNDGIAIASTPGHILRVGTAYQDRDYIFKPLRQGVAAVGQPVNGRLVNAPVFGIGVPIRDRQGHVIGVLAGITDLSRPSFLDVLATNQYGKTGDYFIVAPQQRQIVTGSDHRRIMEVLPAKGVNPEIDRFVDGFEGSTLATNPYGVNLLVSIKRLTVTDWYLSVVLPVDEAFAPIRAMQKRIALAALILATLAAGLTWWMVRRQLKPLRQAVQTLALQQSAHQPIQALSVDSTDEIGQLIGGFNGLLETLREREKTLRASEMRLRVLSEMSSDFFWETDAEHRVTLHSERGRHGDRVSSMVMPLGLRRWEIPSVSPDAAGWQLHREMLDAHLPFRNFEIARMKTDGQLRYVSVSGDPVWDDQGKFAGYLGIGTDITQSKLAQLQIQSLAFFDALTGLPNRRLLMDRLRIAIVNLARHDRKGALLFVDLDNFKALNDTLGHDMGDLLLQQVAKGLIACIREGDTVARLGGDEFVVMLEDLSANAQEAAAQAETVAQKVLLTLNQSYALGDTQRQVTPSIGVTLFGGVIESVEEPLKRADVAMYRAKAAGRNTVRFFETGSL